MAQDQDLTPLGRVQTRPGRAGQHLGKNNHHGLSSYQVGIACAVLSAWTEFPADTTGRQTPGVLLEPPSKLETGGGGCGSLQGNVKLSGIRTIRHLPQFEVSILLLNAAFTSFPESSSLTRRMIVFIMFIPLTSDLHEGYTVLTQPGAEPAFASIKKEGCAALQQLRRDQGQASLRRAQRTD